MLIRILVLFLILTKYFFSNTFLSLYNTTTLDMIITIVGISPPEMHRNAIYVIASLSSSDHVGRQLQFEVITDNCLAQNLWKMQNPSKYQSMFDLYCYLPDGNHILTHLPNA